MSKIVVYTFDGTASGLPKGDGTFLPGPFDYTDPSGSYPQKIGKRLQDYNPNIYEWFPVDYKPYLTITEQVPLIVQSDYAMGIVKADVLSRPAGTKFVLSGLSQGTLSVGRLYNEFRYGNLKSRKNDLVGIVNFGDGLRPAGWTVPFPGTVNVPGSGVIGQVLIPQSYGNVPGLIANPDPFYLSFNNFGDAAGSFQPTGLAREVMDRLAEAVLFGGLEIEIVGGDLFGSLADVLAGILLEVLGYDVLEDVPLSELVAAVWAVGEAVAHWLNIGGAMILKGVLDTLPDIGPYLAASPLPTFIANAIDVHQQYDMNTFSVPFAYQGVANNQKSATQLGYEWCVENLTPLVEPDPAIIYTGGLAASSKGKNKPVFYYAQGTSWLWNWLGFQAGNASGTPVLQIAPGVTIPDFYVLGTPVTGQPYIPATHIKGLDGQYIYWEGGIVNDPFPYLIDTDFWHWKRVQYPASTAFMGPSIEAGVDWVINDILKTPVGTPFALGGYSQGAAVMSRVYNECRQGRLSNRRADLRAAVTFGNPMREEGHTFPNSSGYSGACDINGDTRTGHGSFPKWKNEDFFGLLTSPFIQRFARLQNTEDLFWDFTMPNEVISGVGDSNDGLFLQNFTANGLRLIPLLALLDVDKAMGQLWSEFGVAPAGVPQGTDPGDPTYRRVRVVNPVTGAVGYQPGGGHIMYPFFPPPNSDGSIPSSGDTCYQMAAKYINTVGVRIYDEQNPLLIAPTIRPTYQWFTSLQGEPA